MQNKSRIKAQHDKLINMSRIGGYSESQWRNELRLYKQMIFESAVRTSKQWAADLEEIAIQIRQNTKEE